MQILVSGEGLVDLVPTASGELSDLTPSLGGGPFNVAVAAARLGAQVGFQSRLSTDAFGDALVKRLENEGVDTSLVQRGDEPTTLAVASLDEGGSATYSFYNEGTADRLVEPVANDARVAYFGTLSLAMEPGASRYAEVLHTMAKNGSLIAVDPNIRPDTDTAEHREFLQALLDDVTILKVSNAEAEFLGVESLKKVPVVVTTHGAHGLSVRAGTTELDVPPVKVDIADTIGAGDAVMAALLTKIAEHNFDAADLEQLSAYDWHEILEFAASTAALTIARTGADAPRRAEVDELL